MIYIPSGTIHAIQGGIKLLEVQQSSDVTYRLYDWGRDRETHIKKSLDVINYKGNNDSGHIDNFTKLETPYFTVEKIVVDDKYIYKVEENFECIIVVKGTGTIMCEHKTMKIQEDDTLYIKPNTKYEVLGNLELIKVSEENKDLQML